jgi:hypothetical protein
MLFLIKLTITPVLVALMSLVARRWGPTWGGLLIGLPWMTGPILFFLGLEYGEGYAARTSVGILIGAIGIGAYIVAYVYTARVASWPISLLASSIAYAITGYLISGNDFSPWLAALCGAASLISAHLIVPKVVDSGGLRFLPWWDIPMRMLATAVLVGVITVSAEVLGPELSGIVASYPVILAIIGVFTHSQWGWTALAQLARGVAISLTSFVAFFLVVALTAEAVGLIWAFVLAVLAALTTSAAVLFSTTNRQKRTRPREAPKTAQ